MSFYLKLRFKLRNENVDKEKIYKSLKEIVDFLWELDYTPKKIYIEKLENETQLNIAKERINEFNKKN